MNLIIILNVDALSPGNKNQSLDTIFKKKYFPK